MSQIGSKLKAGFFASPPRQGEYLRRLLSFEGEASVFDPTCGEGLILQQLTEAREESDFTIHTYGVELDKGRAAKAKETLKTAIQAPIESMVISHGIFSMIYLNPPYDNTMLGVGDEHTERKEYTELIRNSRYLSVGGLMMYVIPSYRFADKKIARFLSSNFDQIGITRFTDEDYPDYRQCVFIGIKKDPDTISLNQKCFEFLQRMESEPFVLKEVSPLNKLVGHKTWSIPAGVSEVPTFYSRIQNKSDFIPAIQQNKGFQAFIQRTKPKQLEIGGDPIINIAQGQMALLLASGAVNGLLGEGDSLHAIQGMETVSTQVTEEHTEYTTITKKRTKREVSVKIITPSKVKKLV
ncbi:DUF6094 domain-containing protein [Psychrobacillus sp. MER TA 171]|uniref:DUF6094 domain-containing protein n=1 Tax=Psychrobacillus sp. MER TA 171 TaxID=2939577 RepID=UPI00203E1D82|nr:DUF6094 domain-containing protein [Psychrobacillus sp. MER TA 171]